MSTKKYSITKAPGGYYDGNPNREVLRRAAEGDLPSLDDVSPTTLLDAGIVLGPVIAPGLDWGFLLQQEDIVELGQGPASIRDLFALLVEAGFDSFETVHWQGIPLSSFHHDSHPGVAVADTAGMVVALDKDNPDRYFSEHTQMRMIVPEEHVYQAPAMRVILTSGEVYHASPAPVQSMLPERNLWHTYTERPIDKDVFFAALSQLAAENAARAQ